MNASSRLLAALLSRGDYLKGIEADALQRILPTLDAAHEEVIAKIARAKDARSTAWLAEASADIGAIYAEAAKDAYDEIEPMLDELMKAESSFIRRKSEELLVGVSFTSPAAKSLWALAKGVPVDGSTLDQFFEALGVNAREAVVSAIQRGGIEGETIDELAARLRGRVVRAAHYVDAEGKRIVGVTRRKLRSSIRDGRARYVAGEYEGGVIEGVTTTQARQLARTCVSHVSNYAREAFYAENRDLTKGYQRVEALDSDTCLVCGADDGHVYGLTESRPSLPAHIGCRGTYVPVLKSWRELGYDLEELPAGTRASMDGQVAESETWSDRVAAAAKAGNDARLKAMLGPSRARLYKQGLPVSAMVADGRKLTLEEIAFRRKGKAA